MSQDFMDPELFADFIIEAKEHLETIEPNLLELEKTPDNLSLLNDIFRPMHSLKGASGFLGLNRMNGLAHRAENILDELRKGTMSVTSEIMDIILSTTDALRQMIDNLEANNTEGDVDTAPLIASIDALMAGEIPPPVKSQSSAVSAPEKVAQIESSAPEEIEGQEAEEIAPTGSPRQTGDVDAWIEGLEQRAPYALTAFGEGHLRDFIEEAKENIENLSDGLLELEKNPEGQTELVNDLFRYFHNLKGNSGIIGFNELNSLTHEAETLLNAVRKDSYPVTSPLVDLLLLVVDVLERLIYRIEASAGQVSPFDPQDLLEKLRQAMAGGAIEMPESLLATAPSPANAEKFVVGTPAAQDQNMAVLKESFAKQKDLVSVSIAGMGMDGTNKVFANSLLSVYAEVQNICTSLGLDEIRVYTQRTAGIVEKGIAADLDFSMMTGLLEQESAIILDMLAKAMDDIEIAESAVVAAPPKPAPVKAAAPKASPAAEKSAPPANETSAAPKPTTSVAPKPTASAAPKVVGKPDEPTSKASSTIRVDHEKLDHLMNLIGELIINRNRYTMIARQLEDSNGVGVGDIAQNLSETTYAMARISDDLQDTIMKVRMVPVASVFSRFPRLVRDLSRKSGKDVELIMEGEDTELDKSVVEVIGDPLVHLIRNSVDHGIESAEERQAQGKNPQGKVWLRAFYKGNAVAIEIEDDGKGIDPEKMREVAIRKGVITPEEAKMLDERESMELIFAPGFSSAETITDISGRGVGMDVVRTNIKNLKGSIAIVSEVGKGTKFTLALPLTLAIIDALMVTVDTEMYAIPLDAVSETTKLEASRLTDIKGRKAVTLRGEVLGIVSLAELLGLPCNMANQEMLSVVVVQDSDRRLGLVVDQLLERQEIVIKPLGAYLGDLKGISGATIMGDGSVILILDPHEIYTLSTARSV